MNFNPRTICIDNLSMARTEIEKIGCDSQGLRIMQHKAVYKTIKVEKLTTKEANLLKQTFLGKGGDVAVSRHSADLSHAETDVLIFATLKQLYEAIRQLKAQPWRLPQLSRELEELILHDEQKISIQYTWDDRSLKIETGNTLIMGILNITPDSFSDGGKFNQLDKALEQAQKMVEAGVAIIDVGAESTRPYGSKPVSAAEEWQRLEYILPQLVQQVAVPISIDTYKAEVAAKALKAGAHILNDIWGLQHEPAMAEVAAQFKAPIVMMHNQESAEYDGDIMYHLCCFFEKSLNIGIKAGIPLENMILDPGIGFAKTSEHNFQIMARLKELHCFGQPLLLGASRKRFIGDILNLPAEDRTEGTLATTAMAIEQGFHVVRVHDVLPQVRFAKMMDAMMKRRNES